MFWKDFKDKYKEERLSLTIFKSIGHWVYKAILKTRTERFKTYEKDSINQIILCLRMFAFDNGGQYFYETLSWLQKHSKIVPTQFYNNTSEFSLYNFNCDL